MFQFVVLFTWILTANSMMFMESDSLVLSSCYRPGSTTRKSTWSFSLVLKASAMIRAASLCSRPLSETLSTSRMTWPTFSCPELWAEPPFCQPTWRAKGFVRRLWDHIYLTVREHVVLCLYSETQCTSFSEYYQLDLNAHDKQMLYSHKSKLHSGRWAIM